MSYALYAGENLNVLIGQYENIKTRGIYIWASTKGFARPHEGMSVEDLEKSLHGESYAILPYRNAVEVVVDGAVVWRNPEIFADEQNQNYIGHGVVKIFTRKKTNKKATRSLY